MKYHVLELCYTDNMSEKNNWADWARILQRWGMKEPAAAFIEASGPFNIFLAQAIHFGHPFLKWAFPSGQWEEMANTLENQEDRQVFVTYLRDEETA